VAEFLTDAWVAELVGTGAAPGATGSLQVVLTGAPDGDAKWHARLDDGVVTEAALGTAPAPDLTLTLSYADATAMVAGDLDPSVAFMQGRMKTAGDPGLVLDVLSGAAKRS
jgi:alkyl sulfatase BDS1-like metallo-beta-lactamase superfamily hydrolase